jgi:hypothetical protein
MTSPGFDEIVNKIYKYKSKYSMLKSSFSDQNYKILFVLYPLLVFFGFLYLQPNIILSHDKDTKSKEVHVSIVKFCMWFLIFQLPLVVMYML